jgi:hypothetical protein
MRYYWELTAVERKLIVRQVHFAILRGELISKGCEWKGCNVANQPGLGIVAHHEDYDKPLDVIWLCRTHHKLRHREINKNRPKTWREFSKQVRSEIKSTIKLWPSDYVDKNKREKQRFISHFETNCHCVKCETKHAKSSGKITVK